LVDFVSSNFNEIIKEIIKKSQFTERQIEIILNQKNILETTFGISKGAYFRQVNQCRNKLISFYYSVILLRSLGIILPDDIDVISQLTEQVSVIKNREVSIEKQQQVMNVIETVIRKTCNM